MPTNLTDRVNGALGSLAIKAPVVVATSSSITLSGLQTIAGVALSDGDRVLVKNQTDAAENGIYVASSSSWLRAKDFDGNRDVVNGTLVRDNNSGVAYSVSASETITIGTTEISFVRAVYVSNVITSVTEHGAVGNGVTDDTSAIQSALDSAAASGVLIRIPAGTYILTPSTVIQDEDTGYTTYAALLLRSNLHIVADKGAVFKIANGVSSDAAPKSMCMFGSDVTVTKWSIRNLTMDMNGSNNPISPSRGSAVYNRYNQSQILISGHPGGTVAYADDVEIDNCIFRNNPGACDLVLAQSNSVGADIGRRWKITNNKFLEGGGDTDDHTAVFGWADDVTFANNDVINSSPFNGVGGNTCYEIHGNGHIVVGNRFTNYYRGVWVSSNLTEGEAKDNLIANNIFRTKFYGVDFFRTTSSLGLSSNCLIIGNAFRFDAYDLPVPFTQQKTAIQIASGYEQGHVLIVGNTATSTDTAVSSVFLGVTAQTTTVGQPPSQIVCTNNKVKGFLVLARADSSANNGINYLAICNNTLIEPLKTPTYTTGIGIFVRPTQPIKTLVVRDNDLIDERGSSQLDYGVYIEAGTIDFLYYRPGAVRGITGSEYYEAGVVTINSRKGEWSDMSFTPTFSAGSAITLGNGSVQGIYSINGKKVTVNARLTVGSTTTFPGGSLSFTVPVTSYISGIQYLGQWRIYDASATAFYFGTAEIDGTGSVCTLQINGGTFATNASPVTLANGDIISVQITYSI